MAVKKKTRLGKKGTSLISNYHHWSPQETEFQLSEPSYASIEYNYEFNHLETKDIVSLF